MNHIDTTILHNPRCSKSRTTLALLRDQGADPVVREYLKDPLSKAELEILLEQLDQPASELVRMKESREAGLAEKPAGMDTDAIASWLAAQPQCLERPVVIANGRALIGRPPEQVLALFQ
ncbi:MAG: ArsC/Spx/MgsR family protein [Woeseiaceae bacterium]